jgi:flagellar FliL protein
MAEAAATADDDEKPVVRSAGLPIKLVILIAGGTLVLGLIGTFAYFKFSGHKEEASAETGAAPHGKEEASKEHGNVGVPGAMFDLDPFIVNLADVPESRYLKLTVKLELDRPEIAAELSTRIPQVRDTILILLSSKDTAGLRNPQGKFQLRDELTQRVNALLPKSGVRSAYFTEFVVQ